MSLLVAEVLDVTRECLVDAQAVVGQQRDECRRSRAVDFGGLEQLLEFLACEPDGHRVVGDAGALDVSHWVLLEDRDFDAVAVEARQAREPAGDARRRRDLAGAGLGLLGELAGPERDVVAVCVERVQLAAGAPRVPGLQVGEVRAACLRAATFDEKRGDQAPERVLVELGHAEQSGAGAASSTPRRRSTAPSPPPRSSG